MKSGTKLCAAIVVLSLLFVCGTYAALLDYFGMITTTANTQQAVLLDGLTWNQPITEELTVAGGESFCRLHNLTSQTSVPVTMQFETSFSPEGSGITVTYWEVTGFETTINVTPPPGSIPATITIEDLGEAVKWTVDMNETTGPFNNGHAAVGLVIGVGDDIVFQVHSNDGTDYHYPWGTWLLSYWGPAGTGWHGWHTGSPSYRNTPIAEVTGIEATGDRYLSAGLYDGDMPWGPVYHEGNPNLIFTITVNKGWLSCGEFKWAMALIGDTSDTYTPASFSWSDEDTTNFHTATVGTQITGPFVLQPKDTLDFCIGYKFAVDIMPKDYSIKTEVQPA